MTYYIRPAAAEVKNPKRFSLSLLINALDPSGCNSGSSFSLDNNEKRLI